MAKKNRRASEAPNQLMQWLTHDKSSGIGSVASGGMRFIPSFLLSSRQSDPYCAFKDDRQRLKALISRDVRIAVVSLALAYACASGYVPLGGLLLWLRQLTG